MPFFANWKDALLWIGVMISAGVATAVAIQYVSGYLQNLAQQAAKSEIENWMIISAQTQAANQAAPKEITEVPPPNPHTNFGFIR